MIRYPKVFRAKNGRAIVIRPATPDDINPLLECELSEGAVENLALATTEKTVEEIQKLSKDIKGEFTRGLDAIEKLHPIYFIFY